MSTEVNKDEPTDPTKPLNSEQLRLVHAWWRAANYLSVGQVYLLANPLLREPLKLEHVKPRLLGHWGTTPGLNFIYVHLNQIIKEKDLNVLFICGPGHGAPGVIANSWLERTYSELYPDVSQDEAGMCRSGNFPSPAVSPATPHRRRPVLSMRVANSAILSRTPMGQYSIIRT